MRCCCLIRDQPSYRREAFESGLRALGYAITDKPIQNIQPDDLFVTWNRYGWNDSEATRYERAGAKVIVAENGYLGVDFADDNWYALSLSQHNGAGRFAVGSGTRWQALKQTLAPWREGGKEIVVLPQRSIGPQGVAMPRDWLDWIVPRLKAPKVRVRWHPGMNACVPLEEDLKNASVVVTWGSGAALKALALGIPCIHSFGRWIGAGASTPFVDADIREPRRPDRLATFEKIAWAMWRVSEIADGSAFRKLLGAS